MSGAIRMLSCSVLLLALSIAGAAGAAVGEDAGVPGFDALLESGRANLRGWRVEAAAQDAYKALESASSPGELFAAHVLVSRVEYSRGSYTKALRHAEEASSIGPPSLPGRGEGGFESYLQYVRKAAVTGAKFKQESSQHFILRYAHPKDRVLVAYALHALERSYEEIGRDLGVYPKERVIVEFYPTLKSFVYATGFTREEIRTIGVVGVCNFNRIMVLSPRLLPMGYPWIDTLAHEYTHYLVFVGSGNGVPVWLHEGIAKFEEKRWRENGPPAMDPLYETLLAKAIKDDDFVPIGKMHPSFGKLENAGEAQLAFAQVGSMVDFLVRRWGEGALAGLLSATDDKGDLDTAFRNVTSLSLSEFITAWRGDLKQLGLRERIPNAAGRELEFIEDGQAQAEGSGGGSPSSLRELTGDKARGYALLGDLLRARGRLKAAAYEYEKSSELNPASVVISNRLASTKNALGMYEEALAALAPIVELYPGYFDTYLNMGQAYFKRGELVKAKDAFEAALSINPFHPGVHRALISIYDTLGMENKAESQKRALSIVLGEENE